ncbi:MAG: Hpt domain-containing protein [Myxococcales bacterium]|nr:Hpt domain-containing protein [Myxococcales bacterium]MCH7866511.1 Hpt domain-containing protein [Myxococcales bacterium]
MDAPLDEAPRAEGETSDALPVTTQSILSRDTLDRIRSIGKQGPDLLERVIGSFLSSSPELLVAIRDAATSEDAPSLVAAAHSLKSSSGNVGASRLSELCAAAEAAGKRGAPGEVVELIGPLETAFSQASDALRSEIA